MLERGGRERIPSRPISLLPRAPHLAASSLRVYHRHGGAARREPDQIILLKLLGIHPSPPPTAESHRSVWDVGRGRLGYGSIVRDDNPKIRGVLWTVVAAVGCVRHFLRENGKTKMRLTASRGRLQSLFLAAVLSAHVPTHSRLQSSDGIKPV
jgi:hypothetical protein